jgi:hypothetical protein
VPTVTRTLGWALVAGPAATGTNGLAQAAVLVTASQDAGFLVAPFQLPDDMDPSRPSTITVMIRPGSPQFVPGGTVVIRLASTLVNADGSMTDHQNDFQWPAPDPFTNLMCLPILLDSGSGYTYAGGFFLAQQRVGLRLTRQGTNVNDTFVRTTLFNAALLFTYSQRCARCCCP